MFYIFRASLMYTNCNSLHSALSWWSICIYCTWNLYFFVVIVILKVKMGGALMEWYWWGNKSTHRKTCPKSGTLTTKTINEMKLTGESWSTRRKACSLLSQCRVIILSVTTACWFIYHINVGHRVDCPHTQQSSGRKWQTVVVILNKYHVFWTCGWRTCVSWFIICKNPYKFESCAVPLQCIYLQVHNQLILPQLSWGLAGVWYHKPLELWTHSTVDDGSSPPHWTPPACVRPGRLQVGLGVIRWTAWGHQGRGTSICRAEWHASCRDIS